MSLNSINTNNNAAIALQSLNATSTALQATEKRISTGYRVADATDDGAAYAVAQQVRSDVGALTTANQQLGGAKGLVTTTITALNGVSNKLNDVRTTLLSLADTSTDAATRATNVAKYKQQLSDVQGYIKDASYGGKTLIGNVTGSKGSFGDVGVAKNEDGDNYSIASTSGSALLAGVTLNSTTLASATLTQAAISTTGSFSNEVKNVNGKLATYGNASNYIDSQTTYNNDKIDALNSGLGALVDADLTKESAKLQALQVRQQLASQSLSIANQAPQSLLSLFK